jgi:hypothetical protein
MVYQETASITVPAITTLSAYGDPKGVPDNGQGLSQWPF